MGYRVFRVLGARRSGHHAIITWLIRQSPGKVIFLNNLEAIGSGRSYRIEGEEAVEADESYLHSQGSPEVFQKEQRLRTVIYNFEDYGIAELLNLKARMPTPDDKPTQNILVLRDPLNLLASRVKKYRRTGALGMIGQPFIEHYLEWCRAAAAERLPLKNAIVVNFNLWVTSKTYRADLAAQLGLDFTDEGLNEVRCRGSSFDGFQYNGRAQEMKVLERYEQMMADQIFLNIVCTYEKEIRVVMETLFSAFPAKST